MTTKQIEKAVNNYKRYGTVNPSILTKFVNKLFGGGTYFPIRNQSSFWSALYHYSKATKADLLNSGYAKNSTVYAVVNLIAKSAAQAPWAVYRVKSNRAFQRLKALQSQPYSAKRELDIAVAKDEALELYESHYLNNILLNPNPNQGMEEYMENLLGFKLVTGDSYELADITEGKNPILSLNVMPSHNVTILTDAYGTFPQQELGYKLNVGGREITYDNGEVSHSKYWSPFYNDNGSHLYGFSPLDAAWLDTLEDNNAREAAVEQLQNRGPRGIMSIESNVINEYSDFAQVKGSLQQEWRNRSTAYKDEIMPLFGKAQWHNVGTTIKDLAIIEITNLTSRQIANVYGVSEILLNNSKASTYDNYATARKELITRCVLPLLSSIRAARNRKLVPQGDWNRSNERIIVDYDPTIYTELFDDVWNMAKDMREVGAFTDNEIRIAANYERLDAPFMDEVWKKTNDIPSSLIKSENYGKGTGSNQEAERAASGSDRP